MQKHALKTYYGKRNFEKTPEPIGEIQTSPDHPLIYVIQEHHARVLHYDFRLEMENVLKSWAVPRGPSLDPQERRLAVRTEDHPLAYAHFSGIIPKGQYGGGKVKIWDHGFWEPLNRDPLKSLKQGKLKFRLYGEKLRGVWNLARMKKTSSNKRENWLLIKSRDNEGDKLESKNSSHNSINLEKLSKKYPGVQLASLTKAIPTSPDWIHEIKYDGYRILVFKNKRQLLIRTRNGHDWTWEFPLVAEAFRSIKLGSFVLDGEVVSLNKSGLSDFKMLQNALGRKDNMRAYFFDLLYLNGIDYSQRPLSERRKQLESFFKNIPHHPVLFLSEIIKGKGKNVIQKACQLGLEGIVSKKLNAFYHPDRSKTWLKVKCTQEQEFIICGFIPASHQPKAVGALHLAYYQNNKMVYAGKVGTGFDSETATNLYQILQKLAQKKPSVKVEGYFRNTVWIQPKFLCEVKFSSWTSQSKLRHASYQGLRQDKDPSQIVREA